MKDTGLFHADTTASDVGKYLKDASKNIDHPLTKWIAGAIETVKDIAENTNSITMNFDPKIIYDEKKRDDIISDAKHDVSRLAEEAKNIAINAQGDAGIS